MRKLLRLMPIALLLACGGESNLPSNLDVQGHRGCRGLRPENTVSAFLHAYELGVTTLELDVVISRDSMAVVSHEPWISAEICVSPHGAALSNRPNIYTLTAGQVQAFRCGEKRHASFPEQQAVAERKPTLTQVVNALRKHAAATGGDLPAFNIEIKSRPAWEGEFHPDPKTYVRQIMRRVRPLGVDYTIQSFDVRILQELRNAYPDVSLVYLTESEQELPDLGLGLLGFVPEVYSPHWKSVRPTTVAACREKGMQLIPWTVNESHDMLELMEMGVDGIITDYPNRLLEVMQAKGVAPR